MTYSNLNVTITWRKARLVSSQIAGEVTGEVEHVILVIQGVMKRIEIQNALGLRHKTYFRDAVTHRLV